MATCCTHHRPTNHPTPINRQTRAAQKSLVTKNNQQYSEEKQKPGEWAISRKKEKTERATWVGRTTREESEIKWSSCYSRQEVDTGTSQFLPSARPKMCTQKKRRRREKDRKTERKKKKMVCVLSNVAADPVPPHPFSPDVILCGWLGLKHQLIN